MNLPNKITITRILLVPVFVALCYIPSELWGHWVALVVFIVASFSDYLDGQIARSEHLVTDFGKFLDPIADKMLVTAALCIFVEQGRMAAWVLLIVLMREFAVSALRMIAADKGKVIAAAWSGKVKTASTMVCIVLMLALTAYPILDLLCSIVIALTTLYSGAEYFWNNRDVIDWKDM